MEKWRQLTKEAYVLINSWPLSARQHTWCNEPNTTQNTTGMSYCSWLMTNAFTDSTGWVPNLWDKHVRKTHTSCQNIHFCHYMYNLQPNLSTTLAYSTQQKIIVLIDMHNTHTHTHAYFSEYVVNETHWLLVTHKSNGLTSLCITTSKVKAVHVKWQQYLWWQVATPRPVSSPTSTMFLLW